MCARWAARSNFDQGVPSSFGSGVRLSRRRSLVQTLLKVASISGVYVRLGTQYHSSISIKCTVTLLIVSANKVTFRFKLSPAKVGSTSKRGGG